MSFRFTVNCVYNSYVFDYETYTTYTVLIFWG